MFSDPISTASLILSGSSVVLVTLLCLITARCLQDYNETNRLPDVIQQVPIHCESPRYSPKPAISRTRSLTEQEFAPPPRSPFSSTGSSPPVTPKRSRSYSSPSPRPVSFSPPKGSILSSSPLINST
ncbi:hypothetical protein GEMRC1_006235 [Eukaryota sp. GEM-RC1]